MSVPVTLRRAVLRAGYRVLSVWWFVCRPTTHGVKLVLWSGDRVLFVRHTYGDRSIWELPGGGRKRGESSADAARREAREELGLDLGTWAALGEIISRHRATAVLACFAARYDGTGLTLSPGELAEGRWCPPADPPHPLGPHAEAVLALPQLAGARS